MTKNFSKIAKDSQIEVARWNQVIARKQLTSFGKALNDSWQKSWNAGKRDVQRSKF